MKKTLPLALGLVVCCAGCPWRQRVHPDVEALRRQRGKAVIALPVWTVDAAEEVASNPGTYVRKTLDIGRVYLDPRSEVRVGERRVTFELRGGGVVVMPRDGVPGRLQEWTGAPLKLRALVHPPRSGEEDGPAAAPLLRGLSIDFAHPLELAYVEVERRGGEAWLVASVENYRAEPAGATLDLRFGALHARRRIGPVPPGGVVEARVRLFGEPEPRWADFGAQMRRLRLCFQDGSEVAVDIGKWLEAPADALLGLGYTFIPPGDAVLALSADCPEAELERFAALELRSYLAQLTNANIEPREPEAQEPLGHQPVLVVGTAAHNPLAGALVRQAGLAGQVARAGPEGYVLKSLEHEGRPTLLVASQTGRGLVHGVYGLLRHYGVRFTMRGARLPSLQPFRILDVEETESPVFAVRRLVASGPEPTWSARWSQWRWISMIDQAAKNRFNQVVMPLDGLEATFTYSPRLSHRALFPYTVGPYACVAEAYLAHQRGLAVLADYAGRRGVELVFAHRGSARKLAVAAPPQCLGAERPADLGSPLHVLADPGDFLGMIRVHKTAREARALLDQKTASIAVPYRRGAGARASFVGRYAWDPELTPEAFFHAWASTLCEGEKAAQLAAAVAALDRLSDEVLEAAPHPFGTGPPLVFPVKEEDLACNWQELKARATSERTSRQVAALKDQIGKLEAVQQKLAPIQSDIRAVLSGVAPPWEGPLFEAVPASQRAERITRALGLRRTLFDSLAAVQEGAVAYLSGLAQPADALPRLRVAYTKYREARRELERLLARAEGSDLEPTLDGLVRDLEEQASRLARWLGPASDAEPSARLGVTGSQAVVYRFTKGNQDIYAAYMLAGHEVVHLRLRTEEARLFRRGQPPRTVRAEGGVFLVDLDTVPVYIVARRAPWPGRESP
ncbi:MAG: hypothetical protein ACLF0G_02220 [Candidatus Brocadiia bacterium]